MISQKKAVFLAETRTLTSLKGGSIWRDSTPSILTVISRPEPIHFAAFLCGFRSPEIALRCLPKKWALGHPQRKLGKNDRSQKQGQIAEFDCDRVGVMATIVQNAREFSCGSGLSSAPVRASTQVWSRALSSPALPWPTHTSVRRRTCRLLKSVWNTIPALDTIPLMPTNNYIKARTVRVVPSRVTTANTTITVTEEYHFFDDRNPQEVTSAMIFHAESAADGKRTAMYRSVPSLLRCFPLLAYPLPPIVGTFLCKCPPKAKLRLARLA